jgi:predicted AlkP superfamily phosphohydrolase/phosphomutase
MTNKVILIGLDCAEPNLVFKEWVNDLPNIKSVMDAGMHAKMMSTIPPITVPAWTAMMTSRDPGQLGFYGFRNRSGWGYDDLYFANASYVKDKTVWNHLSRNRLRSLLLSVPQTYPPKSLNGVMVSCFLTPDKNGQYTWPDDIKGELNMAADGDYVIDVKDFRNHDKEWLIEQIRIMTQRRFKAFRHFLGKKEFDFAMMVEMGVDRMHHVFWRYMDKRHRLYEPGNRYENVIHDYYLELDMEVGRVLNMLDDKSTVIIASDHGAKNMTGAICINEWLMEKGLLTLKEKPESPIQMKNSMIDWGKTKVWGEGGYYSRLFFNVKGREPNGTIDLKDYEQFRNYLVTELEGIVDENGKNIGTRALKPQDVYRQVNNVAPDLIVYLGNLDWRSSATIGTGSIYLYENDTGPDDANHAEKAIFLMKGPGVKHEPKTMDISIYDVAPTILDKFGIKPPSEMIGNIIL